MLANLLNIPKVSYISIICAFLLLSACSRDNPLSIPDPFVEENPIFCIEGSPYEPVVLESLDITNLADSLPTNYPLDYINESVTVSTRYLIDEVQVTPVTITDVAPSQTLDLDENENAPNVLVALNKSLTSEASNNLSAEQQAFLLAFDPEINSLSVNIEYLDGQNALSESFDEVDQVSVPVAAGLNYLTLRVAISLKIPRTSIDCNNPLTNDERVSDEFLNSDGYRNVNLTQSFPILIEKNNINAFMLDELDLELDLPVSGQSNKALSISEDFLIIGLPNESTEGKGVYADSDFVSPVDDPTSDPLITFNQQSVSSGSVLVYQRNNDDWTFHSLIKSSNNEAYDFFGSSVAINGSVLAISAPGEDSNASGLYLSADEDLSNLKINNLALSSGAVYLYKYDSNTDAWTETHYIKPQKNVVSDSDYDKGFGRSVAINDSLLVISAPNDNSKTGEAENSEEPNSGAVHTYAFDNDWRFLRTLKALNPRAGDQFGSTVSLGVNSLAVGAPYQDSDFNKSINTDDYDDTTDSEINNNNLVDSGAVYVFSYSQSSNQIQLFNMIKASNSDEFDYFGSSVFIGDDRLFIGAIGEDSGGKGLNRGKNENNTPDSGAVYAYTFNNNSKTWSESTYIKADDTQANASFGRKIVYDRGKLFITSPLYDSDNYSNSGKLYLYDSEPSQITQELLFQMKVNSSDELYGNEIAISDGFIAFTAQDLVIHN